MEGEATADEVDSRHGSKAERYWHQFLASIPSNERRPERHADAFFFGTNPQGAREIAHLVLAGIKTSTGSLVWSYEFDQKRPPEVGDLSVVTDGYDTPLCIVETTEVRTLPFDEVDAEFAFEGGEGDRTLDDWRKMYWSYILSECARIHREPSPKTPLVCERFRVRYKEPLDSG